MFLPQEIWSQLCHKTSRKAEGCALALSTATSHEATHSPREMAVPSRPGWGTRPTWSPVTTRGDTGCFSPELEALAGRNEKPSRWRELSGISLKGHRLLQPACSLRLGIQAVSHADLRPSSKLGVTFPVG